MFRERTALLVNGSTIPCESKYSVSPSESFAPITTWDVPFSCPSAKQQQCTMESSTLKTGTMMAAWLIKPVVVTGTFISLRAFVDPLYSNPHCAARLVNESDPVRRSPQHVPYIFYHYLCLFVIITAISYNSTINYFFNASLYFF